MPETIEATIVVVIAATAPFIIFGIYYFLRKKPHSSSSVEAQVKTASTEPALANKANLNRSNANEPSLGGDTNAAATTATADGKPRIIRKNPSEEETNPPSDIPEKEASIDKSLDDEITSAINKPLTTTDVPHEEQEFNRPYPAMPRDKVYEFFYYVVRMQFKVKIETAIVHNITTEITKNANLQMYQTVLCFNLDYDRWETPRPDKSYHELYWCVPLCNRQTKITKTHMAKIVQTVQSAMRKHNGIAEFPSHTDVEERQEKVDEFCTNVDHCIHAHLIANTQAGGMSQKSGDIVDLALAQGLEEINGELIRQVNGETWYKLTAGGNQEFSKISPDRKVASVLATLDFPHVTNPLDAYDEMFEFALKLSRVLKFQLIDPKNNVIDKNSILSTRYHLESLESYMRQSDVVPGSKLARALFS